MATLNDWSLSMSEIVVGHKECEGEVHCKLRYPIVYFTNQIDYK